jgi:hypothetical protein
MSESDNNNNSQSLSSSTFLDEGTKEILLKSSRFYNDERQKTEGWINCILFYYTLYDAN